jgi:hypothetical protein
VKGETRGGRWRLGGTNYNTLVYYNCAYFVVQTVSKVTALSKSIPCIERVLLNTGENACLFLMITGPVQVVDCFIVAFLQLYILYPPAGMESHRSSQRQVQLVSLAVPHIFTLHY